MSAVTSLTFMTVATAARLGFGMISFVLMARFLGPVAFGVTMFWMAIGTLLALTSNFGFTNYLLREISGKRCEPLPVLNEVLTAKLLLSVPVFFVAAVALPFVDVHERSLFVLLCIAMLLDSVTEFFLVGFRVIDRYGSEARTATFISGANVVIIGGALTLRPDSLTAALAILVSRAFGAAVALVSIAALIGSIWPSGVSRGFNRIRSARAYALDFSAQSLFGQIDSVVLNSLGGSIVVGLHQAGMKLFMAVSQAAPIMGNVFLPRLSSAAAVGAPTYPRDARLVQFAYGAVGAAAGLLMAVFARWIVQILFGNDYAALVALLPWFGLLLYARFSAAAFGVILTAGGFQKWRAVANVGHWLVVAVFVWMFHGGGANVVWLRALVAGSIFLFFVYVYLVKRLACVAPVSPIFFALPLAAFCPLLPWGGA